MTKVTASSSGRPRSRCRLKALLGLTAPQVRHQAAEPRRPLHGSHLAHSAVSGRQLLGVAADVCARHQSSSGPGPGSGPAPGACPSCSRAMRAATWSRSVRADSSPAAAAWLSHLWAEVYVLLDTAPEGVRRPEDTLRASISLHGGEPGPAERLPVVLRHAAPEEEVRCPPWIIQGGLKTVNGSAREGPKTVPDRGVVDSWTASGHVAAQDDPSPLPFPVNGTANEQLHTHVSDFRRSATSKIAPDCRCCGLAWHRGSFPTGWQKRRAGRKVNTLSNSGAGCCSGAHRYAGS